MYDQENLMQENQNSIQQHFDDENLILFEDKMILTKQKNKSNPQVERKYLLLDYVQYQSEENHRQMIY
jgi:hypothetical protein